MATKNRSSSHKGAPPSSSQYPFDVQRTGEKGKQVYDALIHELMHGEQSLDLETAEFMVMKEWPTLVDYLDKIDLDS